MNRQISILLVFISTCAAAAASRVADSGLYALWYGDDMSVLETPYITGGQIVCQWSEVETGPGKHDFSVVAERLEQLSKTGRKASLQINGNRKPGWLFGKVPYTTEKLSVQVSDPQGTLMYWHPTHRDAYLDMLRAFARFLAGSPHRDALLGIRLNFNPVGTEHLHIPAEYRPAAAWTVPSGVEPAEDFSDQTVLQYQDAVVTAFVEHISPLVKVFVRNNIKPEIEERYRHLFDSGKLGWFHTSSEAEPRSRGVENQYVRFHRDCRSGTTVGYAEPWASAWGDHGGKEDHRPFSPPQWNYWRLLIDLHCGVSFIGIYKNDLDVAVRGKYDVGDNHYIESADGLGYQEQFEEAFRFAAKYAGYHNAPQQSPGAWVAFRDGPQVLARNVSLPNQLELDYFTGDYTFLMERLPDSTHGVHNAGPDNQRHGAWARVLPAGQTMRLKPDPGFVDSLHSGLVSVTYLDGERRQGSGFVIRLGSRQKQVAFTGSNTWKTASMETGKPEAGGTITIQSNDNEVCLHMVEFQRKE